MPKKIDAKVKERCVRPTLGHLAKYPWVTAAAEAVARREGVGKESVRRWVLQAQIDGEQRQGASSEELAEIRELNAKVRLDGFGIEPHGSLTQLVRILPWCGH